MTLKILLEEHNIKTKQIELFNRTFNASFSERDWEMKHYSNIYTTCSENVCMYKEENLIGFNMYMPQKYFVGNNEMMFLQSCETVVDFVERGHGYFQRILKKSETLLKEKYSIIYGIPNYNSKPTFDKLGYIEKNSFNIMVKVGSVHCLLKDIIYLLKKKTNVKNQKELDYEFEKDVSVGFSKTIDDIPLPDQNVNNDGIHIVKDKLFYKWKIDSNNIDQNGNSTIQIEYWTTTANKAVWYALTLIGGGVIIGLTIFIGKTKEKKTQQEFKPEE